MHALTAVANDVGVGRVVVDHRTSWRHDDLAPALNFTTGSSKSILTPRVSVVLLTLFIYLKTSENRLRQHLSGRLVPRYRPYVPWVYNTAPCSLVTVLQGLRALGAELDSVLYSFRSTEPAQSVPVNEATMVVQAR